MGGSLDEHSIGRLNRARKFTIADGLIAFFESGGVRGLTLDSCGFTRRIFFREAKLKLIGRDLGALHHEEERGDQREREDEAKKDRSPALFLGADLLFKERLFVHKLEDFTRREEAKFHLPELEDISRLEPHLIAFFAVDAEGVHAREVDRIHLSRALLKAEMLT